MPYRCTFHDEEIPGRNCPHGCSPAAVEELPDPARSLVERLADEAVPWITWTGEQPARSTTTIVPKRKRLRDAKGRMIPEPTTPAHPDEQMSREEILLRLKLLWDTAPPGGKAALARACGYPHRETGRLTLYQVVHGSPIALSTLTGGVQRRMSRALRQIEAGELVLQKIGRCATHDLYEWLPSWKASSTG